MAYGDIPDEPSWSMPYRVNVFQKCPFCGDEGCMSCRPQVRDGRTEKELLEEASQCVKAYCKLREYPNVWPKLGDLERMLIVYAIDFGRQSVKEDSEELEIVDRFKELELR